jgi:hypothetical protein
MIDNTYHLLNRLLNVRIDFIQYFKGLKVADRYHLDFGSYKL